MQEEGHVIEIRREGDEESEYEVDDSDGAGVTVQRRPVELGDDRSGCSILKGQM